MLHSPCNTDHPTFLQTLARLQLTFLVWYMWDNSLKNMAVNSNVGSSVFLGGGELLISKGCQYSTTGYSEIYSLTRQFYPIWSAFS
jgi:hypothetical protein